MLTLGSAEMDHRVVVFEHVHFFNVIKRLHAYPHKPHTYVRNKKKRRNKCQRMDNGELLTELLDSRFESLVLVDGGLSVMRSLLLGSSLSA